MTNRIKLSQNSIYEAIFTMLCTLHSITTISSPIFNLSETNLAHNDLIGAIPSEVGRLTSLESLSFGKTILSYLFVKSIGIYITR